MTNFEAIRSLTFEQLEKFLDQVFLTGLNIGHQSLVDPEIYDGNPFSAEWLNADTEGRPALVEDDDGEALIIEPLVHVVKRIAEFDTESMSEDISWEAQIVLPKGMTDNEED